MEKGSQGIWDHGPFLAANLLLPISPYEENRRADKGKRKDEREGSEDEPVYKRVIQLGEQKIIISTEDCSKIPWVDRVADYYKNIEEIEKEVRRYKLNINILKEPSEEEKLPAHQPTNVGKTTEEMPSNELEKYDLSSPNLIIRHLPTTKRGKKRIHPVGGPKVTLHLSRWEKKTTKISEELIKIIKIYKKEFKGKPILEITPKRVIRIIPISYRHLTNPSGEEVENSILFRFHERLDKEYGKLGEKFEEPDKEY